MSTLRAVRRKCLDCCCGSSKEVQLCTAVDCPIWEYRFGKMPKTAKRYHGDYLDKEKMRR